MTEPIWEIKDYGEADVRLTPWGDLQILIEHGFYWCSAQLVPQGERPRWLRDTPPARRTLVGGIVREYLAPSGERLRQFCEVPFFGEAIWWDIAKP